MSALEPTPDVMEGRSERAALAEAVLRKVKLFEARAQAFGDLAASRSVEVHRRASRTSIRFYQL